jgi:uncharacterized iron-regulated protein
MGGDASAQARQVAALARGADVVYLGEQHDNPVHHEHQHEILDALLEDGVRPALAFEMLDETQQAAVDRALAEASGPEDLDRRLDWTGRGWPDFAMYWPLFEVAQLERLPVIALDLAPAVVRRISREGLASTGDRAVALTSLLPADRAREQAVMQSIRDGHCGLLPESRLGPMVQAWHARNVTMARRLAAAVESGRPVVVIIGRGHQDPGGLPAQLARLRPGVRQLIVAMVEEPAGADGAGGDVVWVTPAVDRGDPCAGLRKPS